MARNKTLRQAFAQGRGKNRFTFKRTKLKRTDGKPISNRGKLVRKRKANGRFA